MPVSIVVPQLGESVAEGTVSKWLKAEGDKVRKEEPLVEIQTDKINVEIPSPGEGRLTKILIPEGTTVVVGTEIGVLTGEGESAGISAPVPATPRPASAPTAPQRAPARVGAAAPSSAPTLVAPPPAGDGGDGARLNLSPAVRALMRENNVSLAEVAQIRGSGTAGRVTRDDLIDYLKQRMARPAAPGAAPAAAPPREVPGYLRAAAAAPVAAGEREELVPFTKVRKLIAEKMAQSKYTAPHVTTFDEVDMSAVSALRREWAPKLGAQGVHLTYMPFFVKAAVFALKEFPWVNAQVKGDALVLKKYYNIGIAVGRGEQGLIVPNIKDCDRKNLVQLAGEVNDLANRARAEKLTMSDIEGGTFSVTNAGVFGALNSSPIINFPEVAILGVHKIQDRPVVRDGQVVVRPMMSAALSFDHRVIDGELGVKFLRRVCEVLERPELLWFHV
jgi:2-oxoglutarate dehydrogenase E2 component (dihydrolipoamide succinyltransferase)